MICRCFGLIWFICIESNFMIKIVYSEKHEGIISGANFRFSLMSLSWICLKYCNISSLEFDMSCITSIRTSTDPWRIKSSKKRGICTVKKFARALSPWNALMKAKSLSPDENPASIIVSTSNVECTYACKRSIAEFYFFNCPSRLCL